MRYDINMENGYIVSVSTQMMGTGGNATKEEYEAALYAIQNKPDAPEGFVYRLRTDLSAELVELPPVPDEPVVYTQTSLETMTNTELEQILYGYGITASMNKANLIRLILQAQGGETNE